MRHIESDARATTVRFHTRMSESLSTSLRPSVGSVSPPAKEGDTLAYIGHLAQRIHDSVSTLASPEKKPSSSFVASPPGPAGGLAVASPARFSLHKAAEGVCVAAGVPRRARANG
jgi:hypothetical protein